MLLRIAASLVVALAIALAARRARALTRSGMAAATIVGTLALIAGWKFGVLLLVYFGSSSVLSQFGAAEKERRTASIVAKGGERDATQVVANGGIFAIAAALAFLAPKQAPSWFALGAGALAASASDTWATEVGTLVGGTPRSIRGFARVPVGMSGGVTYAGTLAAIAGAAFVATLTLLLGSSMRVALGVLVGGVAGSTIDSLLGATLQARRWCPRCERETERSVHDCGTTTAYSRGLALLSNDTVNFICGAMGGLLALLITG